VYSSPGPGNFGNLQGHRSRLFGKPMATGAVNPAKRAWRAARQLPLYQKDLTAVHIYNYVDAHACRVTSTSCKTTFMLILGKGARRALCNPIRSEPTLSTASTVWQRPFKIAQKQMHTKAAKTQPSQADSADFTLTSRLQRGRLMLKPFIE
jgi:hypothetical protein